jgi:hypothetical protein
MVVGVYRHFHTPDLDIEASRADVMCHRRSRTCARIYKVKEVYNRLWAIVGPVNRFKACIAHWHILVVHVFQAGVFGDCGVVVVTAST